MSITAEQFRHVLRVSQGTAKYCGKESDTYVRNFGYFGKHPLTDEPLPVGVDFYGSVHDSMATGAWQREIVRQYADSLGDLVPLSFTLWWLPNHSRSEVSLAADLARADQHHVIAEVVLIYPVSHPEAAQPVFRYMCSGMNDFSGGGKRALRRVRRFIDAFRAIYPDCQFSEPVFEGDTEARLFTIQQVLDEQRNPRAGGDDRGAV